jgi:cytochrome c-type biogenesis protein
MTQMENVSFIMAFAAGFIAFLSPCVLPLIPAYISYLSGISFKEISGELTKEEKKRIKFLTAFHALNFVIGFSIVFVLLGLGITYIGQLLLEYQSVIKRISGFFIIFFALVITDVLKVPFLQREKKLSYKRQGISALGSLLVGATFAMAWTPCVGPILGSILVYASSTASMRKGALLLASFSLGLGVPFFLSAFIISSFLVYLQKIDRYLRIIRVIFAIMLAIFGVVLIIGG